MSWDAVVIGSGHHGLVAANLLADAGWSVLVLEANATPGGATRSAEIAAPGFRSDLCSAFYPLTAASPVIARLGLDAYGLRWRHSPVPLVHVLPDDRTVTLSRDLAETAASVEAYGAGDGERWQAEFAAWRRIRDDVLAALLLPFPPVRPSLRLLRTLGVADALRTARLGLLTTRRGRQRGPRLAAVHAGAGRRLPGRRGRRAVHRRRAGPPAGGARRRAALCRPGDQGRDPRRDGGGGPHLRR